MTLKENKIFLTLLNLQGVPPKSLPSRPSRLTGKKLTGKAGRTGREYLDRIYLI